jgi:hypothetical protein
LARLGTIELLTRESANDGGAAFALTSAARTDALFRFEGAEIELRQGQRDAVVRFHGVAGAAATYQRGHALAQQGLDLLSMLGRVDGVIADAEDEHVLWWLEQAGIVVRLVSTTTLKFGVGPVTVEVRDAQGNIVPPTPVVPHHHIGFRFYRLAQVTDDLYDAYRNMYLAFEVLLSSRFPKNRDEGEGDWLKRGLEGASGDVLITDLVPQGTSNFAQAVLDLIYHDARLPLFHAKEGRAFYAPQDSPANRELVSRALRALTIIVLRMAETWFQTRRMRGGVYFGWLYQQAIELLRGTTMMASGDSSPFDPSEGDLSHARFQDALRMPTRLAPELQRGAAPAVFGSAEAADLTRLPVLRRIDLVAANSPYMAQLLESECVLDGVARLEVLTHIRAMNLNEPKSLFKT